MAPGRGAGRCCLFPSPLSLASSAAPHPLQAKETLCFFFSQEPGGSRTWFLDFVLWTDSH